MNKTDDRQGHLKQNMRRPGEPPRPSTRGQGKGGESSCYQSMQRITLISIQGPVGRGGGTNWERGERKGAVILRNLSGKRRGGPENAKKGTGEKITSKNGVPL